MAAAIAQLELELRILPVRAGSARRLLDASADGPGAAIERLTDGHRVATSDSAEMLALRLLERPEPPGRAPARLS
jgi:hypothetical protein